MMKAKVIIENSKTEIVLTPENEFDKDILEKAYDFRDKYVINSNIECKTSHLGYTGKYKLILKLERFE